MCLSFLWILSLFWWDFPFLRCICRWCFVCVFIHLLHSSLVLFILGVLGPWEFLWRAGSYFSSVWGSALWSVGPVLFIWALAWGGWRGCTGLFFPWALLRWVRYDWNSGEGMVRLSLLSSVCCLLSWQVVVCGRAPFCYNNFFLFWCYLSVSYFVSC